MILRLIFGRWGGISFTPTATKRCFRVQAIPRNWRVAAAQRQWKVGRAVLVISTTKDPASVEDFELDWQNELGEDTIASAVWVGLSGDVTVGQVMSLEQTTKARLSGGTSGTKSVIACTVTLASGETKRRRIHISVIEL